MENINIKNIYKSYEDIDDSILSPFKDIAKKCSEWIRNTVENAGCKGVVVGMSGGIDCSTVSVLAKNSGLDVILVKMPCGNSMRYFNDNRDIDELVEKFNFKIINLDITETVNSIINITKTININNKETLISDMARANIAPRVRMTTLYTVAQSLGYLVIGTDNLSESTMGYFTKWGDGAFDLNPLGEFTKTEVRLLAKAIGVPDCIIKKAPSANLWQGQTDEDEMGITYNELDKYILTGEGSEKVVNIVETAKKKNAHKINPIPVFKK